jgi:hypothetical protein
MKQPPKHIFLENVQGFIGSAAMAAWQHTLKANGYTYATFCISPTSLGVCTYAHAWLSGFLVSVVLVCVCVCVCMHAWEWGGLCGVLSTAVQAFLPSKQWSVDRDQTTTRIRRPGYYAACPLIGSVTTLLHGRQPSDQVLHAD